MRSRDKHRIVGIGVVKNEADIVEAFVRHNLRFLDGLVLLDNISIDGTRDILRELEREGLPLLVLDDPEVAHAQSRKMSALLINVAAVFDPDWIVPLDADEAIDAESREVLDRSLATVPTGSLGRIGWQTYVPTRGDDAAEVDPFRRIRHRRVFEDPQWFKVAVPHWAWLGAPIILADGNHEAYRPWTRVPLPMKTLVDVRLAHFPVRCAEQISRKTICGWLAVLANPTRREEDFGHWREMYERVLSRGGVAQDEVTGMAASYALGHRFELEEAPLVSRVGELQYTVAARLPVLVAVARTAEQVARLSAQREREVLAGEWTLGVARAIRRLLSAPRRPNRGIGSEDPAWRTIARRLKLRSILVIGAPWQHPVLRSEVGGGGDEAMEISYAPCVENLGETSPSYDAVVWWEGGQSRMHDRARRASMIGRLARRAIVWIHATDGAADTAEPPAWPDPNWQVATMATLAFRLVSTAPAGRQRSLVLVRPTGEGLGHDAGSGLVLRGSAAAERSWRAWPRTWSRWSRVVRTRRAARSSPWWAYLPMTRLLRRITGAAR